MDQTYYDIENCLSRITHQLKKTLETKLNRNFHDAGYDITTEQWVTMFRLWDNEGQSQQELAELTYKDKTSITRLINSLEKRNLVVRIPDKTDGRVRLIYLTPKGKSLQEPLVAIVIKTAAEAHLGISEEEMVITRRVLKKVIHNLAS